MDYVLRGNRKMLGSKVKGGLDESSYRDLPASVTQPTIFLIINDFFCFFC